jgi:RNA polymerase sigma-70 factor (ECF subfamily)
MNHSLISPSFSVDLLGQMAQLRRSARRLARGHDDLADDLMQEALTRAWTYRDRFTEGTNLGAWLQTILRNTHISHIRKASREQVGLDAGWEDRLATPATQIDHLALVEVASAMELLSDADRALLVALGVEGRPHEEIALETGRAMGTVRSRLSRARMRLRTVLENGNRGARKPVGILSRIADEGRGSPFLR